MDNAYRITRGDIIYKDFAVLLPPGTFVIQAFIIKIFGVNFIPQIIYCCLISAFTLFLTYRILNYLNPNSTINFVFLLPTIICGGYTLFPHPFYDIDCVFFMLLSLASVLYCIFKKPKNLNYYISGIISALPFFFKQNIGVAYVLIIHIIIFTIAFLKRHNVIIKNYAFFFIGSLTLFFAALIIIHLTCGLDNYLLWTYTQVLNKKINISNGLIKFTYGFLKDTYVNPRVIISLFLYFLIFLFFRFRTSNRFFLSISLILFISPLTIIPYYKTFPWGIGFYDEASFIWIIFIAFAIILPLISIVKNKSINGVTDFLILIPFFVLNAALLNGDLLYSTWSLWPFFSIIICLISINLRNLRICVNKNVIDYFISIHTIVLSIILLIYFVTNYQLRYVDSVGSLNRSDYPTLKGLTTPGSYLPELGNLIEYTNKVIPKNESVLIIPEEVPFYFATKRKPELPFNFSYIRMLPYTDEQLASMIHSSNIKWIILETHLQYNMKYVIESLYDFKNLIDLIGKDFTLYKNLEGYDILVRRN